MPKLCGVLIIATVLLLLSACTSAGPAPPSTSATPPLPSGCSVANPIGGCPLHGSDSRLGQFRGQVSTFRGQPKSE